MAYGDMLTFNHSQIRQAINLLTQIKGEIEKILTNYFDYVDTSLRPAWNTQNGQVSVNKLKEFGNNDIKAFIEYLQLRIEDLEQAATNAQKIDNA